MCAFETAEYQSKLSPRIASGLKHAPQNGREEVDEACIAVLTAGFAVRLHAVG